MSALIPTEEEIRKAVEKTRVKHLAEIAVLNDTGEIKKRIAAIISEWAIQPGDDE